MTDGSTLIRFELLTDADNARFDWLLDDLGTFTAACLGARSLELLRLNLDARLVARGYVTSSVEFPQQNLSKGVLAVRLRLGRLAAIEYVRPPQAAPIQRTNALAIAAGAVVGLRDIEQTLENFARLPSQATQFQLAPAAQPDHSVLRMAVAGDKPWRVTIGINNAAAADFGRWQLTTQGSLDGPLGLSDQLSASLNRSIRDESGAHSLASAMFAYSVPYRYHLFSLTGSRSEHSRTIQGASSRFGERGFDANWQVRWQWTPWRSANARWSVSGAASQRQARTYLEDVELVLQRRKTRQREWGSSLWLRVDHATELSMSYDATHAQAVAPDSDFFLPPPALPRTANAQFDALQKLAGGWQYSSRFSWQSVRNPANGSDFPILGSRWTVRGFDAKQFLSGREMAIWRQDLSAPWRSAQGWRVQPFAALDQGRVGANGQTTGTSLSGGAVGLRWMRSPASGEITIARPLHKPHGFAADPWAAYLNLYINY